MSDYYTQSLVGRRINVNKGGPEAKSGKLLHSGYNYVVVGTDKDGVVYYATRHLKSFGEAVQGNNTAAEEEAPLVWDYTTPSCFSAVLDELLGQNVQINRGGPESRKGKLLLSTYDYIVLSTDKEGVVYFKTDHVKSVSVVQEQVKAEAQEVIESGRASGRASGQTSGRTSGRTGRASGQTSGRTSGRTGRASGQTSGRTSGRTGRASGQTSGKTSGKRSGQQLAESPTLGFAAPADPQYLREYGFNNLFDSLKLRKVKINRGGPDSIEGMLSDYVGGYVVVYSDNEIHRILPQHIKSISTL